MYSYKVFGEERYYSYYFAFEGVQGIAIRICVCLSRSHIADREFSAAGCHDLKLQPVDDWQFQIHLCFLFMVQHLASQCHWIAFYPITQKSLILVHGKYADVGWSGEPTPPSGGVCTSGCLSAGCRYIKSTCAMTTHLPRNAVGGPSYRPREPDAGKRIRVSVTFPAIMHSPPTSYRLLYVIRMAAIEALIDSHACHGIPVDSVSRCYQYSFPSAVYIPSRVSLQWQKRAAFANIVRYISNSRRHLS